MKEWWNNLEKREQRMLIIGAMIVLFILLFTFIYRPYKNTVSHTQQSVQNQQELILWMQHAKQKIEKMAGTKEPTQKIDDSTLLSTISDTLKQEKLNPIHMGQAANNRVNIKFSSVSFDKLLEWLILIWQKYGIAVYSITAQSVKEPGFVDANVLLELRKEN